MVSACVHADFLYNLGEDVLSKGSVDTTLSGDGVRSGREKLGNTSSVEASLGQTEGRTQTGTTGTNDDGIVLVVLQNRSESPLHRSLLHRVYSSAYNNRVLLRDVSLGGLRAQRLVGPYPG